MKQIVVIVALLPLLLIQNGMSEAQTQAIPISLDARAMFTRAHTDFGEQWNGDHVTTLAQFAIATMTDNRWRVRYSFVPGWNSDVTFVPSGSFVVNGTQFVKQDKDKKVDQKPVSLQWHHCATHRLELVPWFNSSVRPLVLAEWRNVSLVATGEKDGKPISASDEWRATLWGVGALFRQQQGNRLVELSACAGDRLVRCEAMLMWRVWPEVNLAGGYSWSQWRIGELKMRETAPWVGVTVER